MSVPYAVQSRVCLSVVCAHRDCCSCFVACFASRATFKQNIVRFQARLWSRHCVPQKPAQRAPRSVCRSSRFWRFDKHRPSTSARAQIADRGSCSGYSLPGIRAVQSVKLPRRYSSDLCNFRHSLKFIAICFKLLASALSTCTSHLRGLATRLAMPPKNRKTPAVKQSTETTSSEIPSKPSAPRKDALKVVGQFHDTA